MQGKRVNEIFQLLSECKQGDAECLYSERTNNHNPDHRIQNSRQEQREGNGNYPGQSNATNKFEIDG